MSLPILPVIMAGAAAKIGVVSWFLKNQTRQQPLEVLNIVRDLDPEKLDFTNSVEEGQAHTLSHDGETAFPMSRGRSLKISAIRIEDNSPLMLCEITEKDGATSSFIFPKEGCRSVKFWEVYRRIAALCRKAAREARRTCPEAEDVTKQPTVNSVGELPTGVVDLKMEVTETAMPASQPAEGVTATSNQVNFLTMVGDRPGMAIEGIAPQVMSSCLKKGWVRSDTGTPKPLKAAPWWLTDSGRRVVEASIER